MSILLYSSVCLILIYLLYRLTVFVNHQADLYEQLKHFPGPKINSKLFGNLDILQKMATNQESVSKEIYYKLTELCDTYGRENGFFRLHLGPCTPWIVICDPMLAKKVLSSPQHFNKAHYYRLLDISCFGNILLSMSAKKARHERRDIIDHFSMFSLDTYITQMEGHLDKLVAKIDECIVQQDGQYHHVNVLVSTFVSDTLEENLFSTKSTSLESAIEPDHSVANEYLFRQTDIALLQPWRYLCANPILGWIVNLFNCQFFSYSLPTMAGIYRLHEVVWCLVLSRYCQLKKAIKQGETKESPSFIDDLLISRVFSQSNLVSKMFAFTGIIRQTIMMLTAGHDTTTSTLSWLLYLLAQYPEVQKKAREEVEQFLKQLSENGETTPNTMNLKRLVYLDACISETIRLYPAAKINGRIGSEPLRVNEHFTLPANVDILIFYDYAHRHQQYFSQPDQFLPERFESLQAKKAIFPFSCGERVCIGKQYAICLMKRFLITILPKYELVALGQIDDTHRDSLYARKPSNFSLTFVKRVSNGCIE